MKRIFLTATALLLAMPFTPAKADAIGDPLHGWCVTVCPDLGTNSPIPNLQTTFGFFSSPANTGDEILKLLVPNNDTLPTSIGVTGTSSGTATRVTGPGGATFWTTGDLEAFLGIANSSPANPIGAYLPSTQAVDPGATGFAVYTFDAGNYSLPVPADNNGAPPDKFTVGFTAPVGSYALADLKLADGSDVATANSGALFVTTDVPVPGPIAGAGIPGIVLGCVGLVGLARRRINKLRGALFASAF
jgi:hypothetical protein